jgi:hypothetical protein
VRKDPFCVELALTSHRIGELVFATSIAMRPEHRFGVHGHTLYVFVYEGEGGHEISILAPSRSTFFDQILDIPMRSIKELTIVIDEFSQIAQAEGTGQIGLEFESGEGNDFFLDSEKIELSSLYLTFQPDNADLFKDALIERCPSIKVAQSDKKAALNPNSSGIQKPSSQVSVIDEVMVGVSNEMQDQEQPSLKLSQGPQLEKNYIRETQAEQGETQKSIDVEDELQSSIDAVVPDPRNNEDDGAAPQTTKEMSKVTPASNVSGFKPPVPPNLKGVKPKAKAPIVARDLRNKPSQASTQEPAVAPQAQTCGKQEQKGSATAAPEKPASQGARGKQKQSEQTSTTQRKTASQAKNVAASSQPQMPPPDSKPHGKTRSARFSQFTDDIEDSKVSDEPKPLSQGTQKASANATKPSASSSQNAPSQTTDARKSKVSVKETTKPSQGRKDPSYQQFSDNYITDVDPIDASTPKVTAAESQARKKTPATSTSNTQTKKLSSLAGTTSQKQKRYSLHPPAKSTPISGDLYDVPPDPDEDEASQKTKGKKSAKAGKSALKAATSAKTTSKTGPKAATKKRQSAPAALGRPTGTRNSQRAAAAKANEQLQGADKSDVEDAELDEQPAPLKSQATKKGKTKAGPDTTKARIAPKEAVDDKVAPVTEEDDEMSPRPQPDALSPSPVPNNAVNHVNADNLYDATPKPPSKKPGSQNPRESTVEDSEAPARVSKAPKKNKPEMKKRNSSLDMASKLGNLLNDVSDNPPETEPQGSIVRKQLLQSDEPIKRKPTTAKNEDAPAVAKSTKSAATNHMEVNSKPNTRVCEVSDSSSLSPTEEHEQEVSTPAPKQVKRFVSQEKSKANDDEIFKKPEIPTHQKKTPNRPDDREPFTAKSNLTEEVTLDEPEQDVATSELVNRVITEAARDAPMEPAHDDQDNAEIGRKRKAELTTITLPKRQRIDENQARAREASPAPSLPSSPPVRAKASPKQSQKSAENMVSPRRSPRLVDRARRAAEVLQQATSEAISAAKDPNRKPHLVTFGVNGALNQGISSTAKVRKDRLSSKNQPQPEEAPKPAHEDVGDKKRKREQLDVVDAETLPSKRRSVSPRETSIIDEYEDGDLPVLQDSSPVEEVKTKSTHNRPSAKPPTRLSSQTSRVDKNGSPLGSSQEDHFGKLQKRLAEDGKGNKSQAPPPARAESPVTVQPRRLSEIFGPRVVLENKPKARKSSPEETAARYIAHEKTANGVYQEVASKQVVALEKKLQDPFTENARKSSGFTERLMSGSSSRKHAKVSKQSEPIMIGGKEKRMPQDDKPGLSLNIPGAPRANLPEPARRTQQAEIRQKTHVEVENQHLFDGSTPSEMTIGTSYESNSSEPDRMPLNEKPRAHAVWNIAIRPHYADLHDAVHRIADVSTSSRLHSNNANSCCRKSLSGWQMRKTRWAFL